MNDYIIKKGTIISENGLPYAPRWFCDGRLSVQVDNDGIGDVHYFGANSADCIVFRKCFWNGVRLYSIDKDGRCMIRPQKCEILPFGFQSDSDRCVFSVYVANETLYLTLIPKTDMTLALEFYNKYRFFPDVSGHADVGLNGKPREWTDFTFENNVLSVSYTAENKPTNIAFSSNTALTHEKRARSGKHILSAADLKAGQEYVCAIHFSNGENKDWQNYKEDISRQFARYQAVADKAPVLKSSHERLNQFFALAPMYHESLKTTDAKGGMRAKSNRYWVWGWDSMTSNDCTLYWGDEAFIGDMLNFMRIHSDGVHLAHAYAFDMSYDRVAAPSTQAMYLCIMDLFRLAGKDVSAHYAFAKEICGFLLAAEVGETGLCDGTSLYPDFPALAHETEDSTISTFNNTVIYCAMRSMEKIALSMNDTETAQKARAFCERTEAHFADVLFHKEMGFIDSSADSVTFEQRGVAGNNSMKWENSYCDALLPEAAKKLCLDFYEKHLVSKAGLRPYVEWSDSYDADSNQFHSWWPVMSEFYVRLVNRFDRPDLMAQYIGWLEYWTERLICPEGIDCYCNEAEVPFNNWDAMPGIWHGYSIRGFYNAVVHGYIGVDIDENGLNFHPYSGEEVSVENLHWGSKAFDISVKGSGKNILRVELNGEDLGAVTTIPHTKLKEHNRITVTRG